VLAAGRQPEGVCAALGIVALAGISTAGSIWI
jgi:multidrug efflux pump subunit AcrB